MAKAPEAERVLEVGEFFAELVEIPIRFRVAIGDQPGLLDVIVGFVGLGPVALGMRSRHRKAPARDNPQLKCAVVGHMRELSKSPGRIRSYFRHHTFRYAA